MLINGERPKHFKMMENLNFLSVICPSVHKVVNKALVRVEAHGHDVFAVPVGQALRLRDDGCNAGVLSVNGIHRRLPIGGRDITSSRWRWAGLERLQNSEEAAWRGYVAQPSSGRQGPMCKLLSQVDACRKRGGPAHHELVSGPQ